MLQKMLTFIIFADRHGTYRKFVYNNFYLLPA